MMKKKKNKRFADDYDGLWIPKYKGSLERWFRVMAENHGMSPKYAVQLPRVWEIIGFPKKPPTISEEEFRRLHKLTWAHAQKYVEKENQLYAQGKRVSFLVIKEENWMRFPLKNEEPEELQQPKEEKEEERPKKNKTGVVGKPSKFKLFGFGICKVLRWMGKNGWNANNAFQVIHTYPNLNKVTKGTCQVQISLGKKKSVDKLIKLSPEDEMELHGRLNEVSE